MTTFIDLDPDRKWFFIQTYWTMCKAVHLLAEINGKTAQKQTEEILEMLLEEQQCTDFTEWVKEFEEKVFPSTETETLPDCDFN